MSMRAPDAELPIVLQDVSVTAGPLTILDRVSLTIDAGAPTVVIGPNGSGKTTLIMAATGILSPPHGRITWGGREGIPPRRRALVFQRPTMLRRSAGANLAYALRAVGIPTKERSQRIARLLDLVGLKEVADRPARRLSGGEQQRLAIARALARDPHIMFLDEPTASLDPASTKAIEDIVRMIAARGIKVVMATHDMGEAKRLAGDVVFLHRGRIVEHSPADTFFAQPRTEQARRFLTGELLL